MAKFRKRPVVIEAFQWTGTNVQDLVNWAARADLEARNAMGVPPPEKPGAMITMPLHVTPMGNYIRLEIETIEGTMEASPGDWIICGLHGEFYSCKPDIFAKSYEAV